MKLKTILLAAIFAFPTLTMAGVLNDDPILSSLEIDRLEWRDTGRETALSWSINTWIGTDIYRFKINSEGERSQNKTEKHELEMLYSQGVSPFWNMEIGLRQFREADPADNWFAFGYTGLAPYQFEMDVMSYTNSDGTVNLRIGAEYEYLLSQRLVLIPELELDYYSDDASNLAIGKGFSDIELGLRLSYGFKREFSSYIGINYEASLGKTADIARSANEDTSELQFLAGISAWF